MTMEEFLYGKSRSTYHPTCVKRVKSYLTRICTVAEKEQGLIPRRITDAWGYDDNKKIWYLCEIKVDGKDLYKAVVQIHDTVNRFQDSSLYKSRGGVIVPVIAIPKLLYDGSVKYSTEKWGSYCSLCETNNIALWIIEQSTVRQLQGPKPKTAAKAKATTKAKTTAKPKAATKSKTVKSAAREKSTAKGKSKKTR